MHPTKLKTKLACILEADESTRKRIKQLTSRPDHLWPELWTKLGRNAKLKEMQKWSNEKPKLYNARRLRGNYFVDPEDKEFKETIKNDRKKMENTNGSSYALQDL